MKTILEIEKTQLLIGGLNARINSFEERRNYNQINEFEFKVFSQFGDDGIIQFLINEVKPKSNIFVEFGVEDYQESNTRFLMMNNNWQGLVIDSSVENINKIINSQYFWKYNLKAVESFITKDNINSLLKDNGIIGDIGILSIDIDGNDYWVWKEIDVCSPDIVICEYNSLLGPEKSITIPYDENFNRIKSHFSGLYFGASLAALCDLASYKGYNFVGSNSAGNNAYFVKKEKIGNLKTYDPFQGYYKSQFRECRDEQGRLTFKSVNIFTDFKNLKFYNTRTNKIEIYHD